MLLTRSLDSGSREAAADAAAAMRGEAGSAPGWHLPVLLEEVLGLMVLRPGAQLIDCTIGDAGHSVAFLTRAGSGARVWGLDRDAEGLARAQRRLKARNLDARCRLVHGGFGNLRDLAAAWNVSACDNILLDLGFSSPQIDDPARGFALAKTGPLDMRMDRSQTLTAADIVNGWPEGQLRELLWTLGEEPHARRIAAAVAERRPFGTTGDLAAVVAAAVPHRARRHRHPATRTFQALRIAVNDELGQLKAVLPQAVSLLAPGGRLLVLSFHSLEDGMVKRFLRTQGHRPARNKYARHGDADMPALSILTKRAVRPGHRELSDNPRCRSARLRVAEKVFREDAGTEVATHRRPAGNERAGTH